LNIVGIGEKIYEIRNKIKLIESELEELSISLQDIPELINSANLLRWNEHLKKITKKQSDLIATYALYSVSLEKTLSELFDIQYSLKEILKEQSLLITTNKKKQSLKSIKKRSKKD
jgi:hypothetical protein